MRITWIILALAMLMVGAPAYSVAQKVVNGGFESGLTGWTTGTYGAPTVVTSGTYGVTAQEGSHFLSADLTRYDRVPKTVLSQSFTAPLADTWYEAVGYVYVHFSGAVGAKQASITLDWGDGTVERWNPSAFDTWSLIDTAHFTQFDSPSAMKLSLEVYGDPLQAGDFVLFDDVNFFEYSTAVPEPGSMVALTALLGAFGLALRRRGCKS